MPLRSWPAREDVSVVADSHCIMAILRYLKERMAAIYREDAGKPIRKSHENPYILKLYEEFLGKPMSEKSHKLLHTHYVDKSKKIIYI